MKKFYLLIIAVMLVSACRGSGEGSLDDKLQTGIDGLTLKFLKNGVPEVIEGNRLSMALEIRNEGFSYIEDSLLVLYTEKDVLKLEKWDLPGRLRVNSDNSLSFNLRGKTLANRKGEFELPSFTVKAEKINESRNKIESMVGINACYRYYTIFSESLCIDTDPFGRKIASKSCKAKDISSSSQGAPVAITKVEQSIFPAETPDSAIIELNIYIENKGKGILIDPEKYKDACLGKGQGFNSILLTKLKFSWYEYNYEGLSDFECSPNPIEQRKKEYVVRCRLKEESAIPSETLTFETPLLIELYYGYKISDSIRIDVLNDERSN